MKLKKAPDDAADKLSPFSSHVEGYTPTQLPHYIGIISVFAIAYKLILY